MQAAPTPAMARRGLREGLVDRPRLFELLERGVEGPVTLVCAPAGSGKTMLLASWIAALDPPRPVAWVQVDRGETDATRFWGTVMDALRASGAVAAGDPLATLVPPPAGGQVGFLQRLLDGLGGLHAHVILVIDDLHELRSEAALRGLEQLVARAPATVRTVVVSRRDPQLGLHRLRLAGELTEIRGADLDFTASEAAELVARAGVAVGAADVARLNERTEGWAAGLRLAALSLARQDAPERFIAEFSGSERTVADYLLAEVLASRPPEVRELLLRTCVLDRVNGPLADLLTGRRDGTRILHELADANALVMATDAGRTWFRYHRLLADLLRLELQREAPEDIPALHRRAAAWHAEHGGPVDAIRHAQLAGDWELAAELLGRTWVGLVLDGEEATLGTLLAGLPPDVVAGDAEMAAVAAASRLSESRWDEADRLLATARAGTAAVRLPRRRRAETALATVELLRVRRLGGVDAVLDGASAMLRGDGGSGGEELRALAAMNLGAAESWTWQLAEAEAHLGEGLALAGRLGRPYLEIGCLGSLGSVANLTQRLDLAEAHLRQAIAVAERVGWSAHPLTGVAYVTLAAVLLDRGRFAEGERLIARADPILAEAPEPAASVGLCHTRGMLRFAQGRPADALAAFSEGARLAERLRAPHFLAAVEQQWQLRSLLRLGETESVRAVLPEGDGGAQWCNLVALVRLGDGDPEGAAAALEPVLAGTAFAHHENPRIEACLLDALARDGMGDAAGAERSTEQALAIAEPQGRVWIFLTVAGTRERLEAHPVHRTAHAAHLRTLLDHAGGVEPAPDAATLPDPLRERELAVLRFLPTNLSAAEIGSELYLSVHTVKTHMRKLYAKLDVHTREDAVQRGRALGLLAPARRS